MTTCCNKTLLTPFCPLCGKPNRDPLLELAAWLREKAKAAGKQASGRERRAVVGEYALRYAAKYRQNERQFLAWAELVIEAANKVNP